MGLEETIEIYHRLGAAPALGVEKEASPHGKRWLLGRAYLPLAPLFARKGRKREEMREASTQTLFYFPAVSEL